MKKAIFFDRDGVLNKTKIIKGLPISPKKLSELKAAIPKYFSTPEIRLEAESDEKKFEIAKRAEEYFIENYECITVDGVRVKFDGGWGLVRASNTQPVIVCRFEGDTPENMNHIQKTILNKLKEFGNLRAGSH